MRAVKDDNCPCFVERSKMIYTLAILDTHGYILSFIEPEEFRELLQYDKTGFFLIKKEGVKIPKKYKKRYKRMRVDAIHYWLVKHNLWGLVHFVTFPVRWLGDPILVLVYRHLYRKHNGKKYKINHLLTWNTMIEFEEKDLI